MTARATQRNPVSEKKNPLHCYTWQCTTLIPAPGRQRLVDFCEFKAVLIYIGNSKTAKAT